MVDLLHNILAIFPALLIGGCQLSLGYWICQKNKLSVNLTSQWAVGLSCFAIINAVLLACGWGQLIHLNILALFLFPYKQLKTLLKPYKKIWLPLAVIGSLLFVANVLNPLALWDAQSSWMGLAKKWANNNSLAPTALTHVYDTRPQIVSVVYTWGLKWGNTSSCQFLDLMFFMAFVMWVGQRFKLSATALGLSFLMVIAGVFSFSDLLSAPNSSFYFLTFIGTGSCEFVFCFLLVSLFEIGEQRPKNCIALLILAVAFLNCRMNALAAYGILTVLFLLQYKDKKSALIYLLIIPLLASPWYFWTWFVHNNPFYPHGADYFNNKPSNSLLLTDNSDAGMTLKNLRGLRNWQELVTYIKAAGVVIFLYPLSLLVKISKENKILYLLCLGIGLSSIAITSQVRFQIFSFVFLAALFVVSPWRHPQTKIIKKLIIVFFVVFSIPAIHHSSTKAFHLLADARHGKEYLLENRVRLYPATQWLNKELKNKNEGVLWAFNPHYYCNFPVIRSDDAVFLLPEDVLDDPKKVRRHLYNLGIRWVVKAKPFYSPEHDKGALRMESYIDWITRNDPHCTLKTTLKATGASPETFIYFLENK